MPSADLFLVLGATSASVERWAVSGTHYARTAEAWLERLDANEADPPAGEIRRRGRALADWRVFFLACAELWGYRGGGEWLVPTTSSSRSDPDRAQRRDRRPAEKVFGAH